jgi:plastocyanin
MKYRTSAFLVLLVALVALVAAGCGGGDDESSSTTDTAADTSGGAGGGAALELAADPGGAPKFDPATLEASAGSVVIDFTNDSSNPHNVTIEGNGIEDVASDTVTGDSTSVTADLEPGTYTFYCSVAGHRDAGMEGTLTVN